MDDRETFRRTSERDVERPIPLRLFGHDQGRFDDDNSVDLKALHQTDLDNGDPMFETMTSGSTEGDFRVFQCIAHLVDD